MKLVVCLSVSLASVIANFCTKELTYHENYGYGFDITCHNLSNGTFNELISIAVSNEISLNIIDSNLSDVGSNLFQNFFKIKFLSIRNSTFYRNDKVFSQLDQLEHIFIDNTQLANLKFNNLKNLKELSMFNANLKYLKNGTFGVINSLVTLKLSINHFTNIFDIPFCEVPNLKFLDLDHNEIENIPDLHSCTQNLIELNLSFNRIKKIECFNCFPNLNYLDLSNNQLTRISTNFPNLERLNLGRNLFKEITCRNVSRLGYLNLEDNLLNFINFENASSLEEINLRKNRLTSKSFKNVEQLPKLIKLNLGNNSLQDVFLKNATSLEELDLSNNQIKLESYSFKSYKNLRYLSLKNNKIGQISITTFTNLAHLESLDISFNRLSNLSNSDIFHDLKNLQLLNLSSNVIHTLNYNLFKPLHNLQVLDISSNKLQDFRFSLIDLLPSLRVITVKSNLLTCGALHRIIGFFQKENISFKINENFHYDQNGVDGDYCKRVSVTIDDGASGTLPTFAAVGLFGLLVLVIATVLIVGYKSYLCHKRRNYRLDEVELL